MSSTNFWMNNSEYRTKSLFTISGETTQRNQTRSSTMNNFSNLSTLVKINTEGESFQDSLWFQRRVFQGCLHIFSTIQAVGVCKIQATEHSTNLQQMIDFPSSCTIPPIT